MNNRVNPVQSNERNRVIDVLRGLALLGIMLMNMPQFMNPSWVYGVYGVPSSSGGADRWAELFIRVSVEGKFFTIFSFLFGLSFYLFMSKAESKGFNGRVLYLRRITALAAFGSLHLLFLWTGDILHLYALTGLLLLFFYRRKLKTIAIWIICLIAVWFGLFGLAFITNPEQAQANMQKGQELLPVVQGIFEEISYSKWMDYQLHMVAPAVMPFEPIFVLAILAMFLIGLYCGKRKLLENLSEKKQSVRKLWFVSLGINLPVMLLLLLLLSKTIDFGFRQEAATTVLVQFSGITMSIFYILSLVWLLSNAEWLKRLQPIGYVGQMALTNYISQSVAGVALVTLFRLHGVGSMYTILLCMVIYALQIGFSRLWLQKFRYGPLEWVWRSFTYLSVQPLLR